MFKQLNKYFAFISDRKCDTYSVTHIFDIQTNSDRN